MTTARLHLGECRDVLRQFPARSIQTVVTSPPYWSLRDYKIPPAIWGGKKSCAHVFRPKSYRLERHGDDGSTTTLDGSRTHEQTRHGTVTTGFCACGAWKGPLGLEPTPELWVKHLVLVFREVRRVLRDDGTVWLNLGDSFWGGRSFAGAAEGTDGVFDRRKGRLGNGGKEAATTLQRSRGAHPVLKEKDLVGQPWRAAFALQADGWYLRSDIVWSKPNPMPESVHDRPTRSHEMLFLLTKSAHYYYDAEAVRESLAGPAADNTPADHARAFSRRREATPEPRQGVVVPFLVGDAAEEATLARKLVAEVRDEQRSFLVPPDVKPAARYRNYNHERVLASERGRPDETTSAGNGADRGVIFPWAEEAGRGKNRRSVWTIPPVPFTEAHFATYPPELVRPCILAGTSARGACPGCGAPWEREVVRQAYGNKIPHETAATQGRAVNDLGGAAEYATYTPPRTTGWSPSCDCPPADPVPCKVLDPFNGAGTTGLVALEEGCDYEGIDVKAEYLAMSRERIRRVLPMFNSVAIVDSKAVPRTHRKPAPDVPPGGPMTLAELPPST